MYFDIPCTSNLIIVFRIVRRPLGHPMRFVSAVCIVSSLVRSVVRIHLIGPIVSVSLICLVIGIMQICPVIQLCFGMCFSWYLSHNQPPFWTEKSPRTLLRAWAAIIRKTALHATKQTRRKNTFFGSILWCKASKQQEDNDSQPANCFLNSTMRIWLESIVSRIYIFFTRFIVYVTAVRYDSYSHDTNDQSSGQSNNSALAW